MSRYYLSVRNDSLQELGSFYVEFSMLLGFHQITLPFPFFTPEKNGQHLCPAPGTEILLFSVPGKSWEIQRKENQIKLLIGRECDHTAVLAKLHCSWAEYFDPSLSGNQSTDRPEDYRPVSVTAEFLAQYGPQGQTPLPRCLENPAPEDFFSEGIFLTDEDYDFLPDTFSGKFLIPENPDVVTIKCLCLLAARFGMETTAYTCPVTTSASSDSRLIQLAGSGAPSIVYVQKSHGLSAILYGRGEALLSWLAAFCLHTPSRSLCERPFAGKLKKGLPLYESSVVYESVFSLPWEADLFSAFFQNQIFPEIAPGDCVTVEAALSEPEGKRNQLLQNLQKALNEKGAVLNTEKSRILPAYKQGVGWMREKVLPYVQAHMAGRISRAELWFRPFLAPGQKDFLSVDQNSRQPDAIAPGYFDSPWLELPIRFLQEFFPGDDLISRVLGIDRDSIVFKADKPDADYDYRILFFDSRGTLLYQDTLRQPLAEFPYLMEDPDSRKVHPATGFIRVFRNGSLLAEEKIEPDTLTFWQLFQTRLLPELYARICALRETFPDLDKAQASVCMELDISMSEPDEDLPFRQDRISSLEALHEDIVNVGHEYLARRAMEEQKPERMSYGWIKPVIHSSDQAPSVHAVIRQKTVRSVSGQPCPVPVSELEKAEHPWNLSSADRPLRKHPEDLSVPETKIIFYEDYLAFMEKLSECPQLEVFPASCSLEGRVIYGVRLADPEDSAGCYTSRIKRITAYPSVLMVARHHANEVSSGNSVLLFLKKLLTEERFSGLGARMNLVILPMENPDGTELHHELQKEHPFWKLHCARSHSNGYEFATDYFRTSPVPLEGDAFTRCWYQLLPDVVIDDHGVPSHECDQPFSGYSYYCSPSFWLPHSIIYNYFWCPKGERFQSNLILNKKMEEALTKELSAHPDLVNYNIEWQKIYKKYAQQWMPFLFAAEYKEHFNNFFVCLDTTPGQIYTSLRCPWITSVSYVSETSDETAQGDYLKLCSHAHLQENTALIDFIQNRKCLIQNDCRTAENGKTEFILRRLRPLI